MGFRRNLWSATALVVIGLALVLAACGASGTITTAKRVSCGQVSPGSSDRFRVEEMSGRVSFDEPVVTPGHTLRFRVINSGKQPLLYGRPFRVLRFSAGRWVDVTSEAAGNSWTVEGLIAEPGRAGLDERFDPPNDIAPGRYRITKSVSTTLSPRGPDLRLCGDFQVVDKAA